MEMIYLAVNGTLMRGLELNQNLKKAGAEFVRETMTEPVYRLWSIGDRHPAMMKVAEGGARSPSKSGQSPPAGICQILLQEPPGLCIGKVRLNNGEMVLGVLGEAFLCKDQLEITKWGGWRAYTVGCKPKLLETKKN